MRPLLLLLLAVLCPVLSQPASAADRPNILFIFTDDHAAQAIGCYGSKINKTPHLDRIAAEGKLFRNCFCTNSLCGPSRATILTGKYSHINGFKDNTDRFDGSQQTVAKLLKAAGYQTAVVGKWHLVSDPTGFDYWDILIGQGPYYNPPMIRNGERVKRTGYTTDIITDLSLEFLKTRDESKPFFLMYQHKAPHRNWEPAERHLDLYDDVTLPEPENLFDDYSGRGTAAKQQEMTIEKHLTPHDLKLEFSKNLTPEQLAAFHAAYDGENEAFRKANLSGMDLVRWKYQRYMKDYLRCVAAVDENVGRMLAYLDESGLAKNTIVIYASDQGFYLGEHGWFDKRFMYEESLRQPLIVRWPGVTEAGSVNSDLVSNLDFASTFLEAAGASIPDDLQGRSLVPILRGETPADWRKSHYYHYYEFPAVHMVNRHYGVRTDKYKLIYFYHLDEWELYDLVKDPGEMHNVADEPAYADVLRELKQELQRLRAQYKVPDDPRPPAR